MIAVASDHFSASAAAAWHPPLLVAAGAFEAFEGNNRDACEPLDVRTCADAAVEHLLVASRDVDSRSSC